MLLASKYLAPSHIHSGAFSGFWIISFSKLVNRTWDDKRAFKQKFGTLSILGDFHLWDLVNAAFSSRTIIFSHSCYVIFSFSFSILPIQLAHILQPFFPPHPFPELFCTVVRWSFFCHRLVFRYFSIEFFGTSLENLILSLEFGTFIKSSFPLCFYLYFLLYFLFDTWNINGIWDLMLSYKLPDFSCFCIFIPFYFAKYWHLSSRSSRSEVFLGKAVLRICSKFTGEHPWRSVIFNKTATSLSKSHFDMGVLL